MLLTAGCASQARNIEPVHIPATKYANHSCEQLELRLDDVAHRLSVLVPIQDNAVVLDSVALPAGLLTLWIPIMFMSGGGHKDELAILKGEVLAIEASAREKSCNDIVAYIEAQRAAAKAVTSEKSK